MLYTIIHTLQLCVDLVVQMEVLAPLLTDALANQDGLEVLVQQVNLMYYTVLIKCNIYVSAVCTSACRNGGTCTAPNRCSCPTAWTGSTCTTRM